MPKTTTGTAHRHKDSRLKWTTDELPHTHDIDLSGYVTRTEYASLDARVRALEAEPIPPSGVIYPPKTTLTYISPPAIPPLPGAGQSISRDGIRVTRVSAISNQRHAYARLPIWNCDGSLMLAAWRSPLGLFDGRTYGYIKEPRAPGYPSWSNVNPDLIYGSSTNANYLRIGDVQIGIEEHIPFAGLVEVSMGDGEGTISDDDHTICLMTKDSSGQSGLLTYDVIDRREIARITLAARPNNASVSRKGTYVIVEYSGSDGTGPSQGLWVYNRDLTNPRFLKQYARHGDPALDKDGREVFVQTAWDAGPASIESWDLATGAMTVVLPAGTAYRNGHVSGRSTKRNGVAYLSCADWTGQQGRAGLDRIVAVHIDGSGIEDFGPGNHRLGSGIYETHAVPSPDGSKVGFASEWGVVGGPVYLFVAEAA